MTYLELCTHSLQELHSEWQFCCARAAFSVAPGPPRGPSAALIFHPPDLQATCASHTRTDSYSTVCLGRCAVLNGAFLGVVVYSLFYIGLEQFAGVTWCLSTGIPCWLTATAFSQHVPHAWAYAIGVHVLSWWAQIHLGHIMLEHRKPALLDSFFQAMTPLHAMPCQLVCICITLCLPAMLHYTV